MTTEVETIEGGQKDFSLEGTTFIFEKFSYGLKAVKDEIRNGSTCCLDLVLLNNS